MEERDRASMKNQEKAKKELSSYLQEQTLQLICWRKKYMK